MTSWQMTSNVVAVPLRFVLPIFPQNAANVAL
jgi:hypothetical protein